jgi:cytoskeleton protein RodZ
MPNTQIRDAEVAASTAPPTLRIGDTLKAAREKRGAKLTEVAERLRLDLAVIQALEEERFDSLGAPVYARGHLRRYAEYLGVANGPLQELYAGLQESGVEPDLTQAPRAMGRHRPRSLLWPIVLLVGAVALISIVWWGLGAQPAP